MGKLLVSSSHDPAPPPADPSGNPNGNGFTLDDVDRKILLELQNDGRRAFRDIARQLDISEATVRWRVKRLRDARVLQILGYVDPRALGYGSMMVLLIKVTPTAHARAVEELTSWRETTWVSTTVGRTNIYVQMLCKDSESLYHVLSASLGEIDGIIDIEMLQEVKVHKAEYLYTVLD
ncbi:Lrp/AsnC family transcriptional regulator [Mycobacterium dioxanotrophicus]|uniref:Lrp/AsnC family transcriptional regulator n=1 Tax=Mycobacterium dioxanotrophicus TaxID=482462 RepID=UPI0012FA6D64|nr:Lrp/AsnC family transcriptional regulator [Mycobacterium dioxanotrophicus]